jgi:hypothetical protein
MKIGLHSAATLVLVALLSACSGPSDDRVKEDFLQLFSQNIGMQARPLISAVFAGEGDMDSVYKHVQFDIVAEEDIVADDGWLAGLQIRKNDHLYGAEVVLLYQRLDGKTWTLTSSNLERAPRQHR